VANNHIYLDHAASTPPWPQALELHSKCASTQYANPSSRHRSGRTAKQSYEEIKENLCETLGFHDGFFLHTSSATESNNQVILNFLRNTPQGKIFIGQDVHPSLSWVGEAFPKQCSWLALTSDGEYQLPNPDNRALFLLNLVSQDIGTLHNTESWSTLTSNPQVHLHVDATQAIGKLSLNLDTLPFHTLSFSSHKFGGIKGSAGLLIRNTQLDPLLQGGSQEDQLRAGTQNLPALAGSFEALSLNLKLYGDHRSELIQLRKIFIEGLKSLPHPILINEPAKGVPWIISFSVPGYLGAELVAAMSRQGVETSTSSACHQDTPSAPRAIEALGRTEHEALGSLRVSFHPHTKAEHLHACLSSLGICLKELDSTKT
jgi:cysteine desulfurase